MKGVSFATSDTEENKNITPVEQPKPRKKRLSRVEEELK